MSAVWSFALAAVGVTGLLIAATRPRIGWWFNIAAQAIWLAYAIATRQWGFLITAVAYAAAYVRLLRRAHQPPCQPGHVYLSTACHHEHHDYCQAPVRPDGGPKVPGECKFCDARCICGCHLPVVAGQPRPASAGKLTAP